MSVKLTVGFVFVAITIIGIFAVSHKPVLSQTTKQLGTKKNPQRKKYIKQSQPWRQHACPPLGPPSHASPARPPPSPRAA